MSWTLIVLVYQFVRRNTVEQDDEDIDHEAVRQKEYLERVVSSQKHQLKQMEKLHKLTHSKMVKDNKLLLDEIAILKREMTDMRKYKIS